MRRFLRLILRVLRGPLFLWRRLQYATGMRASRLVAWGSFPDAPYRAVVFGLEEDMWEHFDAAYPEYEKTFAPSDVHLAELRAALTKRHMALLVFDNASKRHVDTVTGGLGVTVFHASYAPIPSLERDGDTVYGFLIDTVGPWLKARRETEIGFFLENFNLNDRKQLIADGEALKSRLEMAPVENDNCLIIAEDVEDNADIVKVANTVSTQDNQTLFQAHLFERWYDENVVREFVRQLATHKTVVVSESPLGLLACLAGRNVIVSGRPFWAGYGLTTDIVRVNRRRALSAAELISIVVLLLSRYVDNTGQVVDPTQQWGLISASQINRNT